MGLSVLFVEALAEQLACLSSTRLLTTILFDTVKKDAVSELLSVKPGDELWRHKLIRSIPHTQMVRCCGIRD
jgi:hypothetical protein